MRVFIDIADDYCFTKNLISRLKFIGAQYYLPPGRYYEYIDKKILPMTDAEFYACFDKDKCVLICSMTPTEIKHEHLI